MTTPATRGAAAAAFITRRRALTRARAGPRRTGDLARRPDAPSNESCRRALRFIGDFGERLRRRAVFAPRAFMTVLVFLAAVFFADFLPPFLAVFFAAFRAAFFLG